MFWLVLILCFNPANAKDLGKVGPVFEIKELDLLAWIQQKVLEATQSSEWEQLEMKMKNRLEENFKRPTPVLGLRKTVNPRRFIFNTRVSAPYDLKDDKGQIFHRKGDIVNPLEQLTLPQPLFFLDGDDAEQIAWALAKEETENVEAVWILVKGPVFELMKQLKRALYFDQQGWMVKKFGLEQVPAFVVQEGTHLVVEEVQLNTSVSTPQTALEGMS
ncbi:MAG TPA: type-F conjugative transfer system protein TraW [Gammaproteobacteria bacterium]|nr:type-F conjugative transfer system protein TraW [Gammaproteobacteria bacterium]